MDIDEKIEKELDIELKEGDKFMAIVKKGVHSKTLGGEEAAGRKIGPFTATKVLNWVVKSYDRRFTFYDFKIVKIS